MLRWAVAVVLIPLLAFVFVAAAEPPACPPQPIEFSHEAHLRHFRDGHHRRAMESMHEEVLGEVPEELRQGRCTECHGEWEEAFVDVPRIRHCAECHRVAPGRDWSGREEYRPCMGCHNGTLVSARATTPNVGTCAACHPAAGQGGGEEEKLRGFLQRNESIPWAPVYDYLPGDIVFSHERHVELGRVRCLECHGPVEQAGRPLALELKLSMEDCMECHERSGADNDCLACHR